MSPGLEEEGHGHRPQHGQGPALGSPALTRLGHKSLGSAPAASSGATGPSLPRSHLAKPPVCLSAARLLPSGPLRASHTLIFFPFSWKSEKSIHEQSDWSVPTEGEQATPEQGPQGPFQGLPRPPPPPAGRQCPRHAHCVPGPEWGPQPGGRVAGVGSPPFSPRRQPMPCLIAFDNCVL